MSSTRTETVVTLENAWTAKEGEPETTDVILPQGVTDWFVYNYDGYEILYYTLGGKLYSGREHKRIDHAGRIKGEKNEQKRIT